MFPIDVNRADYVAILRVPGIGVKSAKLIVASRKFGRLNAVQLKKMGIVMKSYFPNAVSYNRFVELQPRGDCTFHAVAQTFWIW